MATCTTCGNDYDKAFRVSTADGRDLTFDSIECAAQEIAPLCAHCGVRVLGHGTEAEGTVFCCAHCAAKQGHDELQDRA
jgi:hypothetical protein